MPRDWEPGELFFDGETYDHDRDGKRLGTQYIAVWACMLTDAVPFTDEKGCRWLIGLIWTLADISKDTGAPEASVSARIRDFRKPRFGEHIVEDEPPVGKKGLWRYRLRWRVDSNRNGKDDPPPF